MTADRRFERDLPELLAELGASPAPDYRDEVVRRTAGLRQRPAWTFPERWLPVDITVPRRAATPLRPILIVILVTLAIVAGALVVGNQVRQSRPAPPYGLAANGLIAYSTDGDIRVGDPVAGTSRVLIGGPTIDTNPYFSLEGERLLFVRLAEGEPSGTVATVADLHLATASGDGIRRLTTEPLAGESTVTGAVWSADGARVLLTSLVDGRPELSTVDVSDGSRHRLGLGMAIYSVEYVPPNDLRIVFRGADVSGIQRLYVVDADGGEPVDLTGPMGSEDFDFDVSPDGRSVAYSVTDGSGTHETHVIDLATGVDRVLPRDKGVLHQGLPAWSPDSRSLLVGRAWDTRGAVEVVLASVSADGSSPGRSFGVIESGERFWAPDGSGILTVQEDGHELVLVDVGTARGQTLPFATEHGTGSPDWQRLAP